MNDLQVARVLGWFSLALGATEMLAGRRLARMLGMERRTLLVRAFGAREVAAGVAILTHPEAASGLWARVAGDAVDLIVLAATLLPGKPRRGAVALAATAVAGVTVADVLCARALDGRRVRALATARRTRASAGA